MNKNTLFLAFFVSTICFSKHAEEPFKVLIKNSVEKNQTAESATKTSWNATKIANNADPKDTDNDGIPDIVDIDDDNDGILDSAESNTEAMSYTFYDATPVSRDRKMADPLKRDFMFGPSTLTFNFERRTEIIVQVSIGDYKTPVLKGEISLNKDLRRPTSQTGKFKTVSFKPEANSKYVLEIGSLPVNHLEIFDKDGNQLAGFDFGKNDSPVAPGYVQLSNTTASSIRISTKLDSDGDGIADALDLDSDNDGIPDSIEAQSTKTFRLYNHFTSSNTDHDADKDGLMDRFDDTQATGAADSLGIRPVDTDQDGIPDFRDLDSDNDGLFDIDEAGIRLVDNDKNNDGRTDHFVGINGLENGNGIELEDDYSDPDGYAFDVSFWLVDSDGDAGYTSNAIPMRNDFDYRDLLDTDGDSITDNLDIDDDNDGVSDEMESLLLPLTPLKFKMQKAKSTYQVNGLKISQVLDGKMHKTGFDNNGNVALVNGSKMRINTSAKSNFIISSSTFAKSTNFDVGDFWRFETNKNQDFKVKSSKGIVIIAKGKGFIEIEPTHQNNHDWSISVSEATSLNLVLLIGNEASEVKVSVKSMLDVDDDADGLVNRLDLDSDNDGIPDRIEAYASSSIDNHEEIKNTSSKTKNAGYTASMQVK